MPMKAPSFLQGIRLVLILAVLAALYALALPASAGDAPGLGEAGERPVELPLVLVPTSGSAAYYITHELNQGVPQTSGVFYLSEGSPEGEYRLISARVHYTVLSVDGDAVRLVARAQPVDPWTGELLEPSRWEATYLLAPDGTNLESSDEVPFPYSDLMQPGWLAEWSAIPRPLLPAGPLLPGDEWTGPGNPEWGDFFELVPETPVEGLFLGWVETEAGPAAHIHEGLEAWERYLVPIAEGIDGVETSEVYLSADHWLVPGDFPYGTERWVYVDYFVVVGPSTGAPEGVEGEFSVTMELAFSAVRDANDAVWLE